MSKNAARNVNVDSRKQLDAAIDVRLGGQAKASRATDETRRVLS